MIESESFFDLDVFIRWCVDQMASGVEYHAYDAAFMRDADALFPPPPEGNLRDDPGLRRRLARCMARAIWRQAPHPSHRFGPAPLPSPERNAPCHCGSMRKYKQCCLPIERDMPQEQMNLLPYVLEALPKKRWNELVGSRIGVDMVAHAAHEWIEEERTSDALALLEPWFEGDTHFDARHEILFDMLLDAYTDLGKPRKKATLLDRGLRLGDRTLRSAAMQRRVTMLSDAGDSKGAWDLFAQAQRHEPDSPSLSHLEVTLLLGEGRDAEARERARFWLARLERRRDPDLADLIDMLRDVAARGGEALLDFSVERDPELGGFLAAWRAVPPVAVRYALQVQGDSAGPLEPSPALRVALERWQNAFPMPAYSPLHDASDEDPWLVAPRWLALLQAHPILWDAFEVLDGLQGALADLPMIGVAQLRVGVLDRGERLLREVMRVNRVEGLKLEWGWLQNRPALTLLGERLQRESLEAATPEHMARLEWLVCVLNPDDNQGLRDLLLRRYFELDRIADALALTDRYPDDLAPMRYGRALALFVQQQSAPADAAMRDAVETSPNVLAWLLKAKPKPPRPGRFGVEIGGDEEAWIYREEWLALWQRFGALEWARRFAR